VVPDVKRGTSTIFMNIQDFMLKDPASGGPSTTRTVFFYGCAICLGKLALSGLSLGPLNLGAFSGSDFGMAIAALGGIYALDKTVSKGPPSA
jgi:hypothetical protein